MSTASSSSVPQQQQNFNTIKKLYRTRLYSKKRCGLVEGEPETEMKTKKKPSQRNIIFQSIKN